MKKRYIVLLTLLFLLIAAYFFYARPMLNIYVGYSAKRACSCHFLQNRSIANIQENELGVAPYINIVADEATQVTHASFLGVKRTAVYRNELGCTLLSERTAEELPTNKLTKKQPASVTIPSDSITYPALEKAIDKAFEEPFDDMKVNTRGVLIIKDSVIIVERYGEGFDKNTPQAGWSMTKSITNALVGILVKQRKLDIYKPADITDWFTEDNDPRQRVTIDNLLRMSSGLFFEEIYDKNSTANQMLWTRADAGKVAYSQALAHPVDSVWAYASGTSNVIGHIIRKQFNDYQTYLDFPHEVLFNKLGMSKPIMETDANGTYVNSSLMYATARDWAKFGMLYLQDGVWNGERILPEGWVQYTRTRTSTLPREGFYGAHFWINAYEEPDDNWGIRRKWDGVPQDAYYASGFEGQAIVIVPSKNMVIVRLGQSFERAAWDMGQFTADILAAVENIE